MTGIQDEDGFQLEMIGEVEAAACDGDSCVIAEPPAEEI